MTVTTPGINSFGHVTEFIIFPTSDEATSKSLKIPRSHARPDCLFIALSKWIVPPARYRVSSILPDELRDTEHDLDFPKFKDRLSSRRTNTEVAFRCLQLSKDVLEFMPRRKYCIWAPQKGIDLMTDGEQLEKHRFETKALVGLLSQLKSEGAERVGFDHPEARVAFVHVGSMRSLRKMPKIVERRCNHPEFRFITYGSHECVKPSLWGCREIYPLGSSDLRSNSMYF